MAKVDLVQTTFTGGKISESLSARSDTRMYENSCDTINNFLVRPYGPLISCPGTEYINDTKNSASGTASTNRVRVIEFIFSRTDAYVIEMGPSYFRFFTDGASVES